MWTASAERTDERRLRLSDVRAARRTAGASALLFLTDRCPVECAHCSVDSRADSPTISDWRLFERVLEALAARRALKIVGISGGEPFVERRGLTRATHVLRSAGKRLVVYTSGVWASAALPAWITALLPQIDAVFLSTDVFHAVRLDAAAFARAARASIDAGCRLVVPVLDQEDEVRGAQARLEEALGPSWAQQAEILRNPPLAYGRARHLLPLARPRPAAELGGCGLATSPVIRYDGVALGCCNEEVIRGHGPRWLRRTVHDDLHAVLDAFEQDPLHRGLGELGGRTPALDPQLLEGSFRSVCELCWAAHERRSSTGAAP